MTDNLKRLALRLFDIGAVKGKAQSPDGKGFRLKLHETQPDAPLSPFYLNLRTPDNSKPGPLTPEIVEEIGRQLYWLADENHLALNAVAGVPNAGDPFAAAFFKAAVEDGHDWMVLLKLGKQTVGENRQVVGILEGDDELVNGDSVLVVDDLVTKAHSKLEAIRAIEEGGFEVADVVVLVDRQQRGAEELQQAGYNLLALFTVRELLDLYAAEGRMDQAARQEIVEYLAANS